MKNKPVYTVILLIFCWTASVVHAADALKAYSSSLLELDDQDTRSKNIRLIYTLQNVWNQSHVPEGIKEVKLILKGGSGFDMTNVASKEAVYEYQFGADYRYTLPTAFKLKVGYSGGSPLRHMNHAPSNSIASASVSESINFNLGFSAGESPSIGGGVEWSNRVTYQQDEFETLADFAQDNETITWNIENQTIRHNTPPKEWLMNKWTSCYGSNLIETNELPIVMRSDFKPEAAVVYRKEALNDGQNNTELNLYAGWRKTDYYFGRDICTWYTTWTWKGLSKNRDVSHWTEATRKVSVSWADSLYI
ncbi:dTDP-glucose 4,6-dehydratase [Shewanella sp. VB17]|nr:dTDP-glucose 4,6-dehydratase [Shewanella sp. VB17]